MGLFNKIKDILFEDEEIEETETVKVNNEKKEAKSEVKRPIAEKIEPQRRPEVRPEPVREPIRETQQYREPAYEPPKVTRETNYNDLSDRDLFKSENTFPFPDFDEEEFSSTMNRQQKKPTTNVLEYEKKKKIEKKYDYGRYERTETREVVEKKKFKPSPIISPVYGILNEDYKVEDIKDVTEENRNNNLDFNSVRKKAFGDIEALDEDKNYQLMPSGRYKHNPNYIEKLLRDNGFECITKEEVVLRYENREPVKGFIFMGE